MKIRLIAALLLGCSGGVVASSATGGEVVIVDSAYNRSGAYVGVQGGYYWGANNNVDVTICEEFGCELGILIANSALSDISWVADSDPGGFIGGGQVGYNFQSDALVVGAELDFQIGSGGSSGTVCMAEVGCEVPSTSTASSELEWLGTARGRIGAAFDRTLIYATGGIAFGEVRNYLDADLGGAPYIFSNEESSTRFGWTVGGGAEHALTDKLSLKGEYLYYNLADTTMTTLSDGVGGPQGRIGTYKFSNDGQIVRVGLNYRF
jgi:outer membrane immunogenic protein